MWPGIPNHGACAELPGLEGLCWCCWDHGGTDCGNTMGQFNFPSLYQTMKLLCVYIDRSQYLYFACSLFKRDFALTFTNVQCYKCIKIKFNKFQFRRDFQLQKFKLLFSRIQEDILKLRSSDAAFFRWWWCVSFVSIMHIFKSVGSSALHVLSPPLLFAWIGAGDKNKSLMWRSNSPSGFKDRNNSNHWKNECFPLLLMNFFTESYTV